MSDLRSMSTTGHHLTVVIARLVYRGKRLYDNRWHGRFLHEFDYRGRVDDSAMARLLFLTAVGSISHNTMDRRRNRR